MTETTRGVPLVTGSAVGFGLRTNGRAAGKTPGGDAS
jgi:hypothetical protein